MTLLSTDLRDRFSGEVIDQGSPAFDQARRVWNGMIDHQPALIVRCAGVADVVEALALAQELGLTVSVRGGGHNVAGTAVRDGAIVVDLSEMRRVVVDPRQRRARVEGGATWADVDTATQQYGLATPGGKVSETGVGGLTLGGGLGWLRRRHGLACDNLVSAEVVTPGGAVVTTSEDERPELFWALRGGGGGVGVVTSFELALHPVGPDVSACIVYYDFADARAALEAFRAFAVDCPDEMSGLAMLGVVPDDEAFPLSERGRPAAILAACHCGDLAVGEAALQPLRDVARPIVDMSDTMAYLDLQTLFDEDFPSGELRYYWTSAYLDALDDAVVDLLLEHALRQPSPLSTVDVWQLGGAISRVPAGATAYGHRDAPFMVGIEANWVDPSDDGANLQWARTLAAALQQRTQRGAYLNFPGFFEDGEDVVRAAVRSDGYEQLVAVREKYDPGHLLTGP